MGKRKFTFRKYKCWRYEDSRPATVLKLSCQGIYNHLNRNCVGSFAMVLEQSEGEADWDILIQGTEKVDSRSKARNEMNKMRKVNLVVLKRIALCL